MSIGRIGSNQLTQRILYNIQDQLGQQERLFEQISSNKRIHRPSDDPVAVGKAMKLRDQLARIEEYENHANGAQVWTNVTNVALDNANETWKRVNEIAISAADGTKTSADRAGMAEELEQLLNHLVATANTTHGGRYIFGGSQTDAPAFVAETNANTGRVTGVYYQGDNQIREAKTKDQGSLQINQLGSNAGDPDKAGVFVDSRNGVDMFATMIELRDKLLANDTVGISGSGGVIEDIETASRSIITAQVRIGGTQEVLDLDRNRLLAQSSEVQQFLSEVEDADIAQLILELNNVQNTYEAALAAGGRLLQTGLLNFI